MTKIVEGRNVCMELTEERYFRDAADSIGGVTIDELCAVLEKHELPVRRAISSMEAEWRDPIGMKDVKVHLPLEATIPLSSKNSVTAYHLRGDYSDRIDKYGICVEGRRNDIDYMSSTMFATLTFEGKLKNGLVTLDHFHHALNELEQKLSDEKRAEQQRKQERCRKQEVNP